MKISCRFLLLAAVLFSSGCAALLTRDVTQKEPYRQFIGDTYTLKKGVYIIESVGWKPERTLIPAGYTSWQMPPTLSETFIGQKVGRDAYRIVEVAPAGSIVTLQKAEWTFHTENVFYFARIEFPGGKVYENVGTSCLIDGNDVPPSLEKGDFLLKR
ncbi:MAG: hypothetical protein QM760_20330 [Nibricoccus sp.]